MKPSDARRPQGPHPLSSPRPPKSIPAYPWGLRLDGLTKASVPTSLASRYPAATVSAILVRGSQRLGYDRYASVTTNELYEPVPFSSVSAMPPSKWLYAMRMTTTARKGTVLAAVYAFDVTRWLGPCWNACGRRTATSPTHCLKASSERTQPSSTPRRETGTSRKTASWMWNYRRANRHRLLEQGNYSETMTVGGAAKENSRAHIARHAEAGPPSAPMNIWTERHEWLSAWGNIAGAGVLG